MLRFLRRFAELSSEEIEIVKAACSVRTYRKGEWITRSFSETSDGYFLLKGTVAMLRTLDEREWVSEIFFEGEPLIPAATSPSEGEEHQLRCLDDCEVAETPGDQIESQVRRSPGFESICRQMSEERLRRSMRWNDKFRQATPRERYDFALQERPQLAQRVPQYLLASLLGITPETLSRIRRQIAEE